MAELRPHQLLDLLVRLEDETERAWMLRSGSDLFRAAADEGMVDLRSTSDYDRVAHAMSRLRDEDAVRLADHYSTFRSPNSPFDGNALMNARDIEVTTTGRVLHRNLFGDNAARRAAPTQAAAARHDEPDMTADEVDFFVSYTSANVDVAEWVSWVLEDAGYSVVFQKWDFVPGSNFVLEMDRAAKIAKRTILVLSEELLAKPFPSAEWAAAFAADPAGWERKLVPVRVEDVDAKGLLGQITYIDLVGLDEDAAKARLLQGVQARAKPAQQPTFPGTGKRSASSAELSPDLAEGVEPLHGFVTPEGGRPDRSSFGGIGIMRVQIAPITRFEHPDGVRVNGALDAATEAAGESVAAFVEPQLTPRTFDWIQRFAPRGSIGWASGRASDDFQVLSAHLLAAVTYSFAGSGLSFMVSMGLSGEDGQGKVAFEHLWAAELIGVLLIAGHYFAAVDEGAGLRIDLALQGLDNAVSWADSRGRAFTPDQPKITDGYYEERQVTRAAQLRDSPDEVARALLDRLFMAIDRGQDVVSRIKP